MEGGVALTGERQARLLGLGTEETGKNRVHWEGALHWCVPFTSQGRLGDSPASCLCLCR